MRKISLQAKIGALMTFAILLISATGYLSYRSLSSIVTSIKVKSQPDLRLLAIREISSDLEKAENSVRLFMHTRKQDDIEPYYSTIAEVDDKINRLRASGNNDSMLLAQIDTISNLIEEDILIWNEMLNLYYSDSLDNYIRRITSKLAVGTLSNKDPEKSILKRLFTKRPEISVDQEGIMRDLNNIEKQDSIQNIQLLATESQLAKTGREIRERFNILMSKMEAEVIESINRNAEAADKLALKTYQWLAMFALLGTLLVILVLVIVVKYVRKTRDYQSALIKSKEETEKLATTKELFMANMSHEIRTPVNAIYGFTEQLLYRSFDEQSMKILDIIKSSADHLVKIVNDILDFSKLQNAKIVLENTHFQMQSICEEVQLLFEKKAAENNTRLIYLISRSTPLVLFGDSYRLKQILFNLVGNAVKFTQNGEVRFSVECENKSENTIDLILKVEDNGIGINDDMKNRVFDDFTQADSDTSRKYGGTGLGLSIVKKLVELHKGNITLESKRNRGTTIICLLPYKIGNWEQLPALAQPLQLPAGIRNLKILIVDDEEYNRLLFRTVFDRWNISYGEATNGPDAIDMISTTRYDMVFMDVRMPGLDGLEVTAHIRHKLGKSEAELPVIGISATHTLEDLKEFNLSGMNTFLPKPFNEKMLLDVILSTIHADFDTMRLDNFTLQETPIADSPGVNLDNLYHLADNDVSFVRQMLIRFIESTEQGLQDIHQALAEGNSESALENAHKIAAPCRHIGADVLYTQLKTIEEKARNHDNLTILIKLSDDASLEFASIKAFLNGYIEKINV